MENTSSSAVATWIDTLNATVMPVKPRNALRDLVTQRDINGRAFSMILNEHALTDFNLPDLSQARATKVRKCWHADFPASVGIKSAVKSARKDDADQRYDPCQDGIDYAGFEAYAGYKTGPATGRATPSHVNSGRANGGQGGYARASTRDAAQKSSRCSAPKATVSLEVMRAALDSVAERSNMNRQDMYLGLRDVIPDEAWKPLWESYTSDLVRERHSDAQTPADPHTGAQALHSPQETLQFLPSPARNSAYGPRGYEGQHTSTRSNFPRGGEAFGARSQDRSPEDELANLPELRSRLERTQLPEQLHGEPDNRAWECQRPQEDQMDDDSQSQVSALRSEVETLNSDAMLHWLGKDTVCKSKLSPFELANWLRTLPKDRLDGDTLKVVARHVLDNNMDEDDLQAAITAGGFASLGVSDQRQAQILERYFKQRQSEGAMAAAAKEAGALNRSFRAKQEAKPFQV